MLLIIAETDPENREGNSHVAGEAAPNTYPGSLDSLADAVKLNGLLMTFQRRPQSGKCHAPSPVTMGKGIGQADLRG